MAAAIRTSRISGKIKPRDSATASSAITSGAINGSAKPPACAEVVAIKTQDATSATDFLNDIVLSPSTNWQANNAALPNHRAFPFERIFSVLCLRHPVVPIVENAQFVRFLEKVRCSKVNDYNGLSPRRLADELLLTLVSTSKQSSHQARLVTKID